MEEYKIKYNTWLNDPVISEEDKQDLRSIQNDEKVKEKKQPYIIKEIIVTSLHGLKM